MPLVKNSNLPTFDRLLSEGRTVLDSNRAMTQDIRELHIGFCNLMPDAALEATERQWFRLIGETNRVAQIHIHPFTLPVIERGEKAASHIAAHYEDMDTLRNAGLDALIVTGANMPVEELLSNPGWQDLKNFYEWANENVVSTIYSCFASYAYMAFNHDIKPQRFDAKQFGVFPHYVLNRAHPLVRSTNTKMDVCHSRWGGIARENYERAGFTPLIESRDIGIHMAVSADGFRHICFQGHPEYDMTSLLKEYRRDVVSGSDGAAPVGYFGAKAAALIKQFQYGTLDTFPEKEIEPLLENTWTDSARAIISHWIGHVYQITNVDRTKQFMDGVDPDNPLGI